MSGRHPRAGSLSSMRCCALLAPPGTSKLLKAQHHQEGTQGKASPCHPQVIFSISHMIIQINVIQNETLVRSSSQIPLRLRCGEIAIDASIKHLREKCPPSIEALRD